MVPPEDTTPVTLYSSLSKREETLTPLHPPTVTIYSCGPTLYQRAHIGNLRAYVFADTLHRALRFLGYAPHHVINLTDVGHLTDDADAGDDKVEEEAKKRQTSATAIVESLKQQFFADIEAIGIPLNNYTFPQATAYIEEQIRLAKRLEEKGFTYQTSQGLYFDTRRFPAYGALGGVTHGEGNTHNRVTPDKEKKSNNDFALWKRTAPGVKRQQEWDSPWGLGFPGWHLECSAMAMRLLGEAIDIHTGGMDHLHIHHNNEIAQSEGATDKRFASLWMHCAFLTVNGEKIAKSLGNTYSLDDVRAQGVHPLALRYFFLQANYRSPLTFSFDALIAAQTALTTLNGAYRDAHPPEGEPTAQPHEGYLSEARAAIAHNLNTAKVLAVTNAVARDAALSANERYATLAALDAILGILDASVLQEKETGAIPDTVHALKTARDEARQAGKFEEADRLRKEAEHVGFSFQDNKDGTSTIVRSAAHTKQHRTEKQKDHL